MAAILSQPQCIKESLGGQQPIGFFVIAGFVFSQIYTALYGEGLSGVKQQPGTGCQLDMKQGTQGTLVQHAQL